jgi:sulfur-carrier protein
MNLAHRAPDHAANRQADADVPVSVVLLLFAAARMAAGTGRETLQGRTVADVLEVARSRHGDRFGVVLDTARVWVNGEPAPPERILRAGDEVAVLPPVSGGVG